jgi:hypothetical protein
MAQTQGPVGDVRGMPCGTARTDAPAPQAQGETQEMNRSSPDSRRAPRCVCSHTRGCHNYQNPHKQDCNVKYCDCLRYTLAVVKPPRLQIVFS